MAGLYDLNGGGAFLGVVVVDDVERDVDDEVVEVEGKGEGEGKVGGLVGLDDVRVLLLLLLVTVPLGCGCA